MKDLNLRSLTSKVSEHSGLLQPPTQHLNIFKELGRGGRYRSLVSGFKAQRSAIELHPCIWEDGWGGWIRTNEIPASEAGALNRLATPLQICILLLGLLDEWRNHDIPAGNRCSRANSRDNSASVSRNNDRTCNCLSSLCYAVCKVVRHYAPVYSSVSALFCLVLEKCIIPLQVEFRIASDIRQTL